jgi:hypothetical protein
MPEKDQVYIFNSEELSLIKNTFAENEALIFAIRKVLLQFPLNEGDKQLLSFVNADVLNVLRKRILPELSNVFPLGQLPSLMTTLTNDLKTKDVREMAPHFAIKKLQIAYLEQQFKVLAGEDVEQNIKLADMGKITEDPEENFINMSTYLFLLGYIDPMLIAIKTIAGSKEETLEQLNKRLRRDSAK